MSGVAVAVSAGGAINSAVGSYYSAQSQKSSLQSQAALGQIQAGVMNSQAGVVSAIGDSQALAIEATGDFNASIAELGAQSALDQGQSEIAAATLKAGQLKSSQRAALAANGVDLNQGSAAEVQQSGDIMKDVDVATLKANAVRSAWGYRAQGMSDQLAAKTSALNTRANAEMNALNLKTGALSTSANANMQAASAAGISPLGSAASSLMTGAGQVASTWYSLSKKTK